MAAHPGPTSTIALTGNCKQSKRHKVIKHMSGLWRIPAEIGVKSLSYYNVINNIFMRIIPNQIIEL